MALPLPLEEAFLRLHDFIHSDSVRYGRSDRIRAMRPERMDALECLLTFFVRHCCVACDGLIVRVLPGGVKAAPVTVEYIASQIGMKLRRVERALHDACDLGLVQASVQKKRIGENGRLEVSCVFRKLTALFWRSLQLWELFRQSAQEAKKNFLLKFSWKKIGSNVKKTLKVLTPQNKINWESNARNADFADAYKCYLTKDGRSCAGKTPSNSQCLVCKQLIQQHS